MILPARPILSASLAFVFAHISYFSLLRTALLLARISIPSLLITFFGSLVSIIALSLLSLKSIAYTHL
ncbi:hypothetical protein V8C42DRAFT_305471 [Trichoderma barbatum]